MTTILSARTTPAAVGARTTPRNSYFPALDGLRAVAFLMVFADHYLGLPWGFTGVDCFFVLSGFLITGILYDARHDPHRVRTFYLRRTLRIFPLYYGVIFAVVLLYPVFHWRWSVAWLVWPAWLGNYVRWFYPAAPMSSIQLLADGQLFSRHGRVFLHFGHLWSLCVEEQFYLFWPSVVFLVRRRRPLIALCAAAVVLCPLLRVLLSHTLPQSLQHAEVLYRSTPLRADALLLGGLVALLFRTRHASAMLVAARLLLPVLLAGMLVWNIVTHPAAHLLRGYVYPASQFTWSLSLADILFAATILVALQPRTLLYRALTIRPLRWLGRVSYGAYVFHDIFHTPIDLFTLRHFTHWHAASAAIAFGVTLIAAWASFRWIEAPFLRLKPSSPRRLSSVSSPRGDSRIVRAAS